PAAPGSLSARQWPQPRRPRRPQALEIRFPQSPLHACRSPSPKPRAPRPRPSPQAGSAATPRNPKATRRYRARAIPPLPRDSEVHPGNEYLENCVTTPSQPATRVPNGESELELLPPLRQQPGQCDYATDALLGFDHPPQINDPQRSSRMARYPSLLAGEMNSVRDAFDAHALVLRIRAKALPDPFRNPHHAVEPRDIFAGHFVRPWIV